MKNFDNKAGCTISFLARQLSCAITALALIVLTSSVGYGATYQLIDSRSPSDDFFQPFWLDNERVIFKGYEVGSYSKEMHQTDPFDAYPKGYDAHGMRTGYYVWDTKTGAVRLYKDKIANLCVEDGNVIYETIPAKGEKPVVWRGKFGEEQPTGIEPARWTFTNLQATCWGSGSTRTKAQTERHIIRLRPDWGYLDVGPSNPPFDLTAPVLYYSPERSQSLRLPIPVSKLVNGGVVRFAAHEGKHLIVEGLKNVANVPDAWFLSRDGNLREVILPPGPWLNVELHPIRGGIFLTSAYTKGKKLSEPGGAYLIPEGQWWRLLFVGVKGRAAVSPDGCNVALTVAPDEKAYRESFRERVAGRAGQKTIRAMELCGREKR